MSKWDQELGNKAIRSNTYRDRLKDRVMSSLSVEDRKRFVVVIDELNRTPYNALVSYLSKLSGGKAINFEQPTAEVSLFCEKLPISP